MLRIIYTNKTMPYRRLPNTDNARIRALKAAVEKKRFYYQGDVFTTELSQLEMLLRNFEASQIHYRKSLEIQAASNKKFQKLIRDARLYVSHFIQVVNLSIMRNELRASIKKHYKLEEDSYAVPDLSSNDALLEIGGNLIDGEQKRLLEGGTPIFNPTIARVNVAYSMFKDAYFTQRQYQTSTNRHLDELTAQRKDVDDVILDLWNQIEDHFKDLPEIERLDKCREFGVIYYYRKGEKEELERQQKEKASNADN